MGWGYGVALILELEKLTTFCEDIMESHCDEVIRSESIIDCDRKIFTKIVSITSQGACAKNVVVTSMGWVKAECLRNNLEENSQNIRAQLEDLYHQIPFDELNQDEFRQFVDTYRGFFKSLNQLFKKKKKISDDITIKSIRKKIVINM